MAVAEEPMLGRVSRSRAAVATLALAVLLAPALSPPGPASAAGAAPEGGWLRAEAPWFKDDLGRVVVLRGFNAVEKRAPLLPSYTAAEWAALGEATGANVVRLGITWAHLEPEPGRYDRDLLARWHDVADLARDAGLRVVLDLHQDVFSAKYGGDGAPAWAALDDGLGDVPCPLPQATGLWQAGYACPAPLLAFTNFWLNRDGVQDHLAAAWAEVAKEFRDDPNVVGYDLFNEPHPGLLPPGLFEPAFLAPFYERAAAAIRAVDDRHLIFFEPAIWKSVGGLPTQLLAAPDPAAAYAPHLYAETELGAGWNGHVLVEAPGYGLGAEEAERLGVPPWWGEWGAALDDPATRAANVAHAQASLDEQDQRRAGGAFWYVTRALLQGEGRDALRDALARPFPLAVAGEPGAWAWDPRGGVFALEWEARPGLTEVRWPAHLAAPEAGLAGEGARGASWRWDGDRVLVATAAAGPARLLLRGQA